MILEAIETCEFLLLACLSQLISLFSEGIGILQESGRENYQTFMPIRLVYAPVDIDCGGEA